MTHTDPAPCPQGDDDYQLTEADLLSLFDTLELAAMDPNLSAKDFVVALTDYHFYVRAAAITNPNFMTVGLEAVLQAPDHRVREIVAQNDECPPEVLEMLFQDPHPDVRRAVIRSSYCPLALLEVAVKDPDPKVRWTAVIDARCPTGALEVAIWDPELDVRQAAALHENISPHLQALLFLQWDEFVFEGLTVRPES